ncbi:MAG: GNAT family N-acetyltransferase [Bacteroidetes bacterium]|nr:GNAT family N-acetyltransferase [Bacteroidota bacterium]
MRINYRRWELKDVERIRRFLYDTWLDTYGGFIPHGDIKQYLGDNYNEYALRSFFTDQNTVGFIAEVDGELAGYEKTFFDRKEDRLYVQQLYILHQYQGMGLGRQLMAFAADHALTYNLDRVWLSVMANNTPALLWYQNMGYQIKEKTPFTLGKTTVEHYIGYVPVNDIFQLCEK